MTTPFLSQFFGDCCKKGGSCGALFFCLFFGKNDRKNEMKTQVIGRFLKLDSLNNNVVVDIYDEFVLKNEHTTTPTPTRRKKYWYSFVQKFSVFIRSEGNPASLNKKRERKGETSF